MKIVYYTDQIYLHGGIERVLANKLNFWVNEYGFETHIITTEQNGKPPCYEVDNKVLFHDLDIKYDRKRRYLDPVNFFKLPKHFFRLKRKLKEIDPDVVVVCNFAFDFYFIPFLHKRSKKIKEFHSSRYFDHLDRLNNRSLIKKIYYRLNDYVERKYDHLVLLTIDEIPYYSSNNTVVIPNALSNFPDRFSSLTTERAISAGRIAPVKGFERLIESWVTVNKKYPDWKLDIYGHGEQSYISKLQQLINGNQLENKITLCGSTSNLEEEMVNSSLYIMTSLTECFPMVLLESLAVGLPVVSFDCPNGPRNIISNNEDGILVTDGDVDEMAGVIIGIIDNKDLRKKMGKKARTNIKRLLPQHVMKQWLTLFQE
ncbi:glycosyltransferase family 4 protein [Spongiivirga sp. MCCC 1A20706]|uniref:glycosyltransferase family 4 protein n=1 Tax=Spongiivirga sp. MCCC 1A20706 TaxID=3160963 RepID=UPI00397734CD